MDNSVWCNILTEWVNCLNLCQHIKEIEELKKTDFFPRICSLLRKNKDDVEDIKLILNLISNIYPKCVLKISSLNLQQLTITELTYLISMLLHYSCIYDRRDILTVPLCKGLNKKTQIYIRNFLEKVNTKTTYEELLNIITHKKDTSSVDNKTLWSTDLSLKEPQSPLQEMFTPNSKINLPESKTREIIQLKSALQLERYEKADLQEELKLQLDINKNMEKQLQQKLSEISRLKMEIITLENKTPLYCQDNDFVEIKKQLKSEILSLEQYISQSDEEQKVLRKEKDSAKEMIRKLEQEVSIWQEKFFLTENNLQTLSEQTESLDASYKNLQQHCTELEAFLEETKTLKDSHLDETNKDLLAVEEDLAHSVVDLQLKEVKKQNDVLKMKLKESEECASIHQMEVTKLTRQLRDSDESCVNLVQENKKLNSKLLEAKNDFAKLDTEVSISKAIISDLNKKNTTNKVKIANLINKLDKMLKVKNELVKNNIENLKAVSTIHEQEKMDMSKEYKLLDKLYKNQTDVVNKTNEELKSVQNHNNHLLKNISELNLSVKSLEHHNTQKDMAVSRLKQKTINLEAELINTRNNSKNNLKYFNFISKQNNLLSLKIKSLNSEIEEIRNDNCEINKKFLEEKNSLTMSIEEKDIELSNLKIMCSDKEDVLNNQHVEISHLRKTLDAKEKELICLNDLNINFMNKVENLNKEVVNLKEIKEKLTESCLCYKEYWLKEINEVNDIFKKLQNINFHLDNDTKELHGHNADSDNKINIVNNEKENIDLNNKIVLKKMYTNTHDTEIKTRQKQDISNNEYQKLKDAYCNIKKENTTLESENKLLQISVLNKNEEIKNYVHVKGAYEHVLEENNKLLTELDTIKYKRKKEKEEIIDTYKRSLDHMKKEEARKIKHIRIEYEGKLEKMKEKMLTLYKQEQSKAKTNIEEKVYSLKVQLEEAKRKLSILESEKKVEKDSKIRQLENSLYDDRLSMKGNDIKIEDKNPIANNLNTAGWAFMGSNLKMEDEDEDLFNEKYLLDLKEGTNFLTGRESTASRVSVFAQRNSKLPPHLKSSYPAEMQFVSPSNYKEEEIKAGSICLDDSMSKLIPSEKTDKRLRKDFGTTSYKKPGPPTPSKNAGRLSLHSNEVYPLKDEKQTPKKITPRLKTLFRGRHSIVRDNFENQSTPKRRSIFRKPKP